MHRETKKAPDVQVIQEGGDDRVSGTDADRHDDISHNSSSWFGGNTDSTETADLARVLINAADCSAVFYWASDISCPKNVLSMSN